MEFSEDIDFKIPCYAHYKFFMMPKKYLSWLLPYYYARDQRNYPCKVRINVARVTKLVSNYGFGRQICFLMSLISLHKFLLIVFWTNVT